LSSRHGSIRTKANIVADVLRVTTFGGRRSIRRRARSAEGSGHDAPGVPTGKLMLAKIIKAVMA